MFSQYLANGLLAGSITALVGVGFLIIYRTCKFFHFGLGAVIAAGAYCALLLVNLSPKIPLIAFVLATLFSLVAGLIVDFVVYRTLRRHAASGTGMLIAALGIYSLIQNSISVVFGDDTRSFRWWPVEAGWPLLGVRVTTVQILIVFCSWSVVALTWVAWKYSSTGKAMQAVASDRELAQAVGINAETVYLCAMGFGSMLAGIAGILIACDVDITPTMGMQPFLMGVVAVIVGGTSIRGTCCGALLLGLARHLGVIWLPTRWQDAITFGVLLVFLLFRPQGFFGKRARGAAV